MVMAAAVSNGMVSGEPIMSEPPTRQASSGTTPHLPSTAALDGVEYRSAAEAALEPESPLAHRVGTGFITLYTLAYMGTFLMLLAPVLVTLALKINSLVGPEQAGTDELGPGRRRRCPAGHVRQPALRPDE